MLLILVVPKVSIIWCMPISLLVHLTTPVAVPDLKWAIKKNVSRFGNWPLSRNHHLLVYTAWKGTLSLVHALRRKNTADARAVCTINSPIVYAAFCYLPLPLSVLHWPVSESGYWIRRKWKGESISDMAWLWLYSNVLWSKQSAEFKVLLVKVNNSTYLNQ